MGCGSVCLPLLLLFGTVGAQGSLPCSFDSDFCAWTQDSADDADWERTNGSTSSPRSGPLTDHTTGNGFYAYFRTNQRVSQVKARLLSPQTDGAVKCLSFWYLMYGDNVGNLNVYFRSGPSQPLGTPVFTRALQINQAWEQVHLDINSTAPLQVVIEAARLSDLSGDIAIDDISVADGICTTENSFECVGRADDFYANPTDCQSFYRCFSGRTFLFDCPSTLMFNTLTNRCDWTRNVDCQGNGVRPATTTLRPAQPDVVFTACPAGPWTDGAQQVTLSCSFPAECITNTTSSSTGKAVIRHSLDGINYAERCTGGTALLGACPAGATPSAGCTCGPHNSTHNTFHYAFTTAAAGTQDPVANWDCFVDCHGAVQTQQLTVGQQVCASRVAGASESPNWLWIIGLVLAILLLLALLIACLCYRKKKRERRKRLAEQRAREDAERQVGINGVGTSTDKDGKQFPDSGREREQKKLDDFMDQLESQDVNIAGVPPSTTVQKKKKKKKKKKNQVDTQMTSNDPFSGDTPVVSLESSRPPTGHQKRRGVQEDLSSRPGSRLSGSPKKQVAWSQPTQPEPRPKQPEPRPKQPEPRPTHGGRSSGGGNKVAPTPTATPTPTPTAKPTPTTTTTTATDSPASTTTLRPRASFSFSPSQRPVWRGQMSNARRMSLWN